MLNKSSSVIRSGSLSFMGLPFRLCGWCRSRHFTDLGRPAHAISRTCPSAGNGAKRDGSHALTLRVSSFVVMPLLEHGENHSTGAVNV